MRKYRIVLISLAVSIGIQLLLQVINVGASLNCGISRTLCGLFYLTNILQYTPPIFIAIVLFIKKRSIKLSLIVMIVGYLLNVVAVWGLLLAAVGVPKTF